ncbi:MAG: DUF1549 domain-containing protein [Mariniblastus sp.]|nr:DUF1549 domain-containing protein [Mariniblastus sp.]
MFHVLQQFEQGDMSADRRTWIRITAVGFIVCLIRIGSPAAAEEEINFNRDIRPILSENCFFCHGQDEKQRQSGLRLDQRESALESESIIPGDAALSPLIERTHSDDPDLLMPPPDSNRSLTDEQKRLLKRWVEQGAPYQPHWAFVAPQRPSLPPVAQADWVRNPIDTFVLAELESRGLAPSPEADRNKLIRRLSIDLTGLPPTPQAVRQFVEDTEPQAYERLVDRLLASPHYGERLALPWLDAARYSDSNGFQQDGDTFQWAWRDWVVRALNDDLPFDQFTTWQLAGDLLPEATLDQKIASGFNRNHMLNGEGGAIAEEQRFVNLFDRIDTTSTTWLGLTMACAQCHDHKYDPITQRDYYSLMDAFNRVPETGTPQYQSSRVRVAAPFVEAPTEQNLIRIAEFESKLAEARKVANVEADRAYAEWRAADERVSQLVTSIADYRKSCAPQYKAWQQEALAELASRAKPVELKGMIQRFSLDESEGETLNETVAGLDASLIAGKLETVARLGDSGVKLDGKTHFDSANAALELKHDRPFTLAAWIKSDGKAGGAVFSRMDISQGYRGFDVWVQGGIGTHIIHQWPGNAIKVISKDQLVPNQWQHVVISYDGGQKASGVKIYIDGKLSEGYVESDNLTETIETEVPFRIGGRTPMQYSWNGGVDDIRIYNRELTVDEVPVAKTDPVMAILAMESDQRSEAQERFLLDYFLDQQDPNFQKLTAELTSAQKRMVDFDANFKNSTGLHSDEPFRQSLSESARAALAKPAEARSEEESAELEKGYRAYFETKVRPTLKSKIPQLKVPDTLQAELSAYRVDKVPKVMVMSDAKPRKTSILNRGQYLQPAEAVTFATPEFLLPMPEGAPANRLGLAQWLVADDHPLTSRVQVNRMWQYFFGTGIVKTTEDLGVQSEYPVHKALLDWLAVEFREAGWSMKSMHRLILTSATYRQSSRMTEQHRQQDPENRLYARASRFRMPATILRDWALASAGLLVDTVGGAPVYPYQPDNVWEPLAITKERDFTYPASRGDDLYRRSLYTFWRRTVGPANMFDSSNRQACRVRATPTSTPLHALTTLNDPTWVEAARNMAARLVAEGGPVESRLSGAFQQVLSRSPSPHELSRLSAAYQRQVDIYSQDPESSKRLLAIGESELDSQLDPAETAALTAVCLGILNLDEALTRE